MAVDHQQRHLGSLAFDHMPYPTPHFTNPWAPATSTDAASHLFPTSLAQNNLGLDAISKQQAARANSVSMPYSSIPVTAPSTGAGSNFSTTSYGQPGLLNLPPDLLHPPRSSYGSDHGYTTAPSPNSNAYAPTSAPYAPLGYAQSFQQQQQQQQAQDDARRLSQPSGSSSSNFLGAALDRRQRQNSVIDFNDRSGATAQQSQQSFGDALDAGRGMVAMSQDMTPRNIYGPRSDRGSTDGYGFPATHSSSSSISSGSTYPSYFGSSVESSVSDYSSASECMEPISSRTLPRPTGLLGANLPPAPQSMMSQFNSKVSSSTQKKHKCKVCDKRFTRPSSLQTHMYSHTGEKRKRQRSMPIVYLADHITSLCLQRRWLWPTFLRRLQSAAPPQGP